MPYSVVRGDTLSRIAAANGTTVAELLRLNPQITNPDVISVGQNLKLPGDTPAPGSKPKAGGGSPADPTKQEWEGKALKNMPGEPEVWKVGKSWYIVYMVPGTEDDPVYMSWSASSWEAVKSWFGPGKEPTASRVLTGAQFRAMGAVNFGNTSEIPPGAEDPFASWASELKVQKVSQPWIMDDDYQRLMAGAMIEGRGVTDAEIKTTNWWRTHNAAERQWMILYHGDPKSAQKKVQDNKISVRNSLIAAGAGNKVDQKIIDYMTNEWTQGRWTQAYLAQQIRALTDPYSKIKLDAGLAALNRSTVGTTRQEEDTVRELIATWLGPAFGNWSKQEVARQAGLIRNDPDYQQELIERLKDQRMALFPEYTDRNTSYAAISNNWKQWWLGQWGEMPDEKDSLFVKVLRQNDMDESAKLLRREGLKRGIGKVQADLSQAGLQLGNSERNPVLTGG